ncbi:MAG: hypothetical protein ABSF38_01770 [Verrucomicrobiota bacterium]|jgi:hypothetical protein
MAKVELTQRRVSGGIVAFIGFMLSPLSWWNDTFVNLPLALLFAWVVSWFYKPAFAASLVLGYWLSNVLGFVLMHKGGSRILSEEDKPYGWKGLARDVAVSLIYTVLIVALVRWGILKPMQDYLHSK